jgi:hypothetical protein
MRLAWFRAHTNPDAQPFDDVSGLIRELSALHDLHLFTPANAHDFVWREFTAPYDARVFELDDTQNHAFMWPYLLVYSGILLLRARSLHDSRAEMLIRTGRVDDYVAEFTFSEGYAPHLMHGPQFIAGQRWGMLRAPLVASQLAVVPHLGVGDVLRDEYPEARIRYAPHPVREVHSPPGAPGNARGTEVTFGISTADRIDLAREALAHARARGANARLLVDIPERIIHAADVVMTLQGPGLGDTLSFALAAMSGARPILVLETETSADWPLLDPQTWKPRGPDGGSPLGVSVDARDEEHSLTLAMHRLAADDALRTSLGNCGRTWWSRHGTTGQAVQVWGPILDEAITLERPARPAGWPAHLSPDGAERARQLLEEFGVTADLLETRGQDAVRPLLRQS